MPNRFIAKFDRIKLEGDGKITPAMQSKIERFVKDAAREWLRAVVVRIPIWTGMSRGALAMAKGRSGPTAGKFLRTVLNIQIPIGSRTSDSKAKAKRIGKTSAQGGRESRFTFSYDEAGKRFNFTYQTDVVQFIANDLYNVRDGAAFGSQGAGAWARPWGAMKAGDLAFDEYVARYARKFLTGLINLRWASLPSKKDAE